MCTRPLAHAATQLLFLVIVSQIPLPLSSHAAFGLHHLFLLRGSDKTTLGLCLRSSSSIERMHAGGRSVRTRQWG